MAKEKLKGAAKFDIKQWSFASLNTHLSKWSGCLNFASFQLQMWERDLDEAEDPESKAIAQKHVKMLIYIVETMTEQVTHLKAERKRRLDVAKAT